MLPDGGAPPILPPLPPLLIPPPPEEGAPPPPEGGAPPPPLGSKNSKMNLFIRFLFSSLKYFFLSSISFHFMRRGNEFDMTDLGKT
jgi:hypothetical protein